MVLLRRYTSVDPFKLFLFQFLLLLVSVFHQSFSSFLSFMALRLVLDLYTKAIVDVKEEAVANGVVADKLPLDTCSKLEASAQHLAKEKVDVTLLLDLAKVTVDVKLLLGTWPTCTELEEVAQHFAKAAAQTTAIRRHPLNMKAKSCSKLFSDTDQTLSPCFITCGYDTIYGGCSGY